MTNHIIFKAVVIVCSDRAFNGIYADESGPTAQDWLEQAGYSVGNIHLIPDNPQTLTEILDEVITFADLVIISGGTGLGPKDYTPQTLDQICDYYIPGIGELLRQESLKYSRNAYLSRCGAWSKNKRLILALPGSKKAVKEQLDILNDLLEHAIYSLRGTCKHR